MLLCGILAPMLQYRKLPRGIRWVDSEWSFGVTAPPTLKPRITQERPFRLLFSGFHKVIEVYEDDDAGKPMGYIAVIMPLVTADGLDPLAEKTIACQEQEKNGKGHLPKKWADYRVDLKDIEQKAGVSFPKLADVRSYNR